MGTASIEGRDVALYSDDSHELEVLTPIGAELERRGARVRVAAGFDDAADVGLYACHTSGFYDFDNNRWRRPPNTCSVQSLHDLGPGGASDAEYLANENWEIFDLGLLPGPGWSDAWRRARDAGARGPALGMREVGWPKMDHVYTDPEGFARHVRALGERLGLGSKPVLLLACSWSNHDQLRDTLARIDTAEYDLVVKYPASELPPPDSPWFDLLMGAYDEMKRARELALATPNVVVADDDADIMALVKLADVVLSDGSNVLYEGILAGVPGICIRQWPLRGGRHGELEILPYVDLPGVVTGDLDSLATMLRIVRHPVWAPLVAEGAGRLVAPGSRGRAAASVADAIEEGLATIEAGGRPERTDDAGDRPKSELEDLREALRQADERELRAREQLRSYEQQLAELRGLINAESPRR
jgi:hypothetical protein